MKKDYEISRNSDAMVNKIFLIIMLILALAMTFIPKVSAITMYGGEEQYFDFSEYDNIEKVEYEFIGGEYSYEGLRVDVRQDLQGARLFVADNYKPDSFGIVFTITEKKTYTESCPTCKSSSGGSKTKVITRTIEKEVGCDTEWVCDKWSDCNRSIQNRECIRQNTQCYNAVKPITEQSCSMRENSYGNNNTDNETQPVKEQGKENGFGVTFYLFVLSVAVLIGVVLWNLRDFFMGIYSKINIYIIYELNKLKK